jgi:superfamily II DNA or RNA helicase
VESRPYQLKAHASIKDGLAHGTTHQLIQMATGTGKTVVFSHLPEQLKETHPGKMLVLAHREELIDQAIEKMSKVNPTLRIDKEMAEHRADPEAADVIVASVATLGRKGTKRLDNYDWSKFDKFVVDEAHHSVASSYTNIYEAAGLFEPGDKRLLLGVTATPQRGDGQALAKLFQKIVFSYSMRQAIEDGWLVEPRGFKISTDTSLDGIKVTQGEYDQTQLANTVNTPKRNQLIAKAWLDHAQGRQTVGFSVDIQHAKDLAAVFKHYGIKAEALWGDDPQRAEKLAAHRAGEITILFNCGVLIEGYDDWQIGCVILAGPTKSPVKFTQMVGRGTRLQDGIGNLNEFLEKKTGHVCADQGLSGHCKLCSVKTDCIVLDVVDASSRNSLVTLPTLMGMSAKLDLRGKGIVTAVKELEDAQKQYPHIDFAKLDDITQLQQHIETVNLFDVKFPPEVEGNSELSWYPSPTGGYVMLLPNGDKIEINQNLLDKYEITANIKGNKYRGERGTIEAAFSAADDTINKVCPEALKVLRRVETWHKDPATPAQMKLLAKFYKGRAIPPDLSKGQASKLISSFMAGKK